MWQGLVIVGRLPMLGGWGIPLDQRLTSDHDISHPHLLVGGFEPNTKNMFLDSLSQQGLVFKK